MKKRFLIIPALLLLSMAAGAQSLQQAPANWFNLDPKSDKVQGISTERTYSELLKGKKFETVIVAVIDGGVDTTHEDLKSVLWKNRKEIAGNGKDDDGNGYVDDVYGWNFIGGKDGRNINYETMELTRLYAPLAIKYKDGNTGNDAAEFARYQQLKTDYDKELAETEEHYTSYQGFYDQLSKINSLFKAELGVDKVDIPALQNMQSDDLKMKMMADNLVQNLQANGNQSIEEAMDQIKEGVASMKGRLDYGFNLNSDERAIVGDDPSNINDRNYGNNDVTGPDASHGTHVAGIIAAARNNGIGMNGIADHVQIMAVRAVPNGDERDKDVANAIRYAVDNGARVINMSFGKSYNENKKAVDDAVAYAASKDVLLVHAAGNDGSDNDTKDNFPNAKSGNGKRAENWIEVGALSWKGGEDALADFSNYGKTSVDVFAPGVDIYSTVPFSQYKANSGTSMASPVVAGIAAVIRSYYPKLTALQVKEIITKSAERTPSSPVKVPGDDSKTAKLSDLSITGGVVNLYDAVKMAEKM